jgi:hypothetical protein
MVSGTLSLSCSECFSPFPHGTCSLSVSCSYLALPDGPGKFRQDSSCPALLRILPDFNNFTCTGLSPSITQLSRWFHLFVIAVMIVLLPHHCRNNAGLGYFHFARHYSGNHFCFLFLPVLRCFSSQGSLPDLHQDIQPSTGWVTPFGYLRITGYLHLPEAFRSLSRPSSPSRAKASPIRPYLLSLRLF